MAPDFGVGLFVLRVEICVYEFGTYSIKDFKVPLDILASQFQIG
jgi:hypothetical protein